MDSNQKGESRLNRAEILAALDYEIASIEMEQTSPGWTKWTFYGGFATLVWVACWMVPDEAIQEHPGPNPSAIILEGPVALEMPLWPTHI